MQTKTTSACLVVGAGDGLGGAVAQAFAAEGLEVVVTRRPRHAEALEALATAIRAEGGRAHAFGLDARREEEVAALVDRIERDIAPLEVVVFNIGANVRFALTETTTRVYTKVWEMAALAGFLTVREAARVMSARGRGTILVTGATASGRGGAGYSAFAGAKHALRALTQSAALPPMAIRTLRLGEDAGQLPMLAGRVADFYDAKLQRGLDRIVGAIGPASIIVISVIVGGLIVSVMTALLSVNQIAE